MNEPFDLALLLPSSCLAALYCIAATAIIHRLEKNDLANGETSWRKLLVAGAFIVPVGAGAMNHVWLTAWSPALGAIIAIIMGIVFAAGAVYSLHAVLARKNSASFAERTYMGCMAIGIPTCAIAFLIMR
ncbi:hypothetical protein [Shinella granuli]|uniref:hypothetical protein n=1 Tax=Shinella granuli TaxID=323621 RepID=UPI0010541665|nr:hypothetical protein [Shinella granuli]